VLPDRFSVGRLEVEPVSVVGSVDGSVFPPRFSVGRPELEL
jgi:hypothetical protein